MKKKNRPRKVVSEYAGDSKENLDMNTRSNNKNKVTTKAQYEMGHTDKFAPDEMEMKGLYVAMNSKRMLKDMQWCNFLRHLPKSLQKRGKK